MYTGYSSGTDTLKKVVYGIQITFFVPHKGKGNPVKKRQKGHKKQTKREC